MSKKKKTTKESKLTHKDVIKYSRNVLRRPGKLWTCPITFMELSTASYEIPDVIGFHSGGSGLIEAKVTRNDFLSDKRKFFRKNPDRGMGNWRFYACPTGLIKPEEIPEKWGLIYVSEKGRCTIIVKPERQESDIKQEHGFLYSIIRRIILYHSLPEIDDFIKKYSDYDKRMYNIQMKVLDEERRKENEAYNKLMEERLQKSLNNGI